MKKRKIWRTLLVAAAIILMACTVATAAELIRVPVRSAETFGSADGTIEFTMNIDEEVSGEFMPVLEVAPHQITPEEAKRVAYALFGDTEYYEAEAAREENYSKSEIRQRLDRWSQYTTVEAVQELYGSWATEEKAQDVVEIVESFIQEYEELYETAPEDGTHIPCKWEFQSEAFYMLSADELADTDPGEWNSNIAAMISVDGIPFWFCASNRDKEDFKVNTLSACISTGITPNGIDEEIFRARLLRTQEPIQEQLDAAKAKAEKMLADMDMGTWLIDGCYVDTWQVSEDVTEYSIHVTAVPVLNGVPAVRVPQFYALRDAEDPTVSNYYYADVEFDFAPNGQLIDFTMYSPIEIVDSVEYDGVLSMDQLLEKAKDALTASNYGDYSYIPMVYSGTDELGCRVDVTGLDYNLTRVNKPGFTDRFYYVPGITLTGDVEYYEKGSSKVIETFEKETLLILNGTDGTVIDEAYN
ncbi:MAG: hypothetical protein IJ375_02295 [Oscillospiraceae bacterium]|nr:hypothetical protein [Oscillospiraceae bacterium]